VSAAVGQRLAPARELAQQRLGLGAMIVAPGMFLLFRVAILFGVAIAAVTVAVSTTA
jgi:hypothetical protein